jgi:Uma2 family endonuclease
MADALAVISVGPEDHGRRMSFADFQRAEPRTGHVYELARGVIQVTDIPGRIHALVLEAVNQQLAAWRAAKPGVIHYSGGGAEAKTELPQFESERHPDRSLYLTPMPRDDYPWDQWIPEIVIEVVSRGADAQHRDYVEKREEYLAAGIREYWIIDPETRSALMLTRHGDTWREHKLAADGRWQTHLLPGFVLELSSVFSPLDA